MNNNSTYKIYDYFEDEYGFIHKNNLLDKDCWITYVKSLPEVDRVVKIKNDQEQDISKEKIAEILQGRAVNEEVINEFIKVLDNCDYARYTPSTDVMMKQEFDKAREVIANLDKEL